MIRVTDLRKTFRSGREEIEALCGVSLEVDTGSCCFIIGPSGSGKSTLLYLLGALDNPTSGSIFIDGEELASMSEIDRDLVRRRQIGFIFQQFNLIPNLTALGNVLLPYIPLGVTSDLRAKATALLKDMGLGNRLRYKPTKLSGGEQQRVAIARALIKDPTLLLADEPTGNLDRKNADAIFALLRAQQATRGCTLIVVTHDRRFIQATDLVIEIQDGRLISENGRPDGDGRIPIPSLATSVPDHAGMKP
jgi:putative ABC transport system ATP-binding protein